MKRIERLRRLWDVLNTTHFNGGLSPVPIRITRSRRTYGYFNAPDTGGQPSIRISTVLAITDDLLRDTMLHEMIHQYLHAVGCKIWDEHGTRFQVLHHRIFGHLYEEPS